MAYSKGQDENTCSCMDGCFLWLKPASRKDLFYSPELEWKITLFFFFFTHCVSLNATYYYKTLA